MSDQRPKRESMSIEEATVFNMWEIAEAQQLAWEWTPKGNERWLRSSPQRS